MSLRFASLLVLALASGCVDMQWRKPGVDEGQAARDLDGCRRMAREQSFHELNARVLSQPYGTGVDARGHATLAPPLASEGDRGIIEQDLLRACMRRQGYELAPAQQRFAR